MKKIKTLTTDNLKRLNKHGFKCIHIFRNLYLVRKYGKGKRFSTYSFYLVKN